MSSPHQAHCRGGLNTACMQVTQGGGVRASNAAAHTSGMCGKVHADAWRMWYNQSSFRSGPESYAYLYHQLGFGASLGSG